MTRGGYRLNAKRPLKFGEKTVIVRTSVPESKSQDFKLKVARILKKWIVKDK